MLCKTVEVFLHGVILLSTANPFMFYIVTQVCHHVCSEEKELTSLIISDLYYHLQGRLEGREIPSGPFQELSNFLLSLGTFECNDEKYERIFFLHLENISMFDIKKVQEEIGAELWDLSDWTTSKEVAESMFMHMHSANSSLTIASSKHFALEALVSVIAVYKGNVSYPEYFDSFQFSYRPEEILFCSFLVTVYFFCLF